MEKRTLTNGENKEVYGRITKIDEMKTKVGSSYIMCTMNIGHKAISVKKWNTSKEDVQFKEGDIVNLDIDKGEWKGKDDYTIKRVNDVDTSKEEAKLDNYINALDMDREELYNKTMGIISTLGAGYRDLAQAIYEENKEQIIWSAAASSVHHNLIGGLLWHSYRMAIMAEKLAEVYVRLDRDILVTGVLLHDIGKLKEMSTNGVGDTEYTVDGNLFGHLYLGAEMIGEYAKRLGLDEEVERQIKHIIVSHHSVPEWGNIKEPITPEASMVCKLDLIDAEMYRYEKTMKENEEKHGEIVSERYSKVYIK